MLINLLPDKWIFWEKYKVDFLVFGFAVVIPVTIMMLLLYMITQDVHEVESSVANIRQEIESFKKITQAAQPSAALDNFKMYLQATEKIWQTLGLSGSPVCLSEVSRQKNKIIIIGKASSIVDMQNFSEKLSVSGLFSSIDIGRVEKSDNIYVYRLHVKESQVLAW